MAKWQCSLCMYVYDDSVESVKWEDLPPDWACPICGSPKSAFVLLEEEEAKDTIPPEKTKDTILTSQYTNAGCALLPTMKKKRVSDGKTFRRTGPAPSAGRVKQF